MLNIMFSFFYLCSALPLVTEASREIQAKLEMETHQQADELDIAKEKVILLCCFCCLYLLCYFELLGVVAGILQRLHFFLFASFLSLFLSNCFLTLFFNAKPGGQAGACWAGRGKVPKEAGRDAGTEEAEQGPVWQDGPVLGPDPQSRERQQGTLVVEMILLGMCVAFVVGVSVRAWSMVWFKDFLLRHCALWCILMHIDGVKWLNCYP